jgi:hypothetical protein
MASVQNNGAKVVQILHCYQEVISFTSELEATDVRHIKGKYLEVI